MMKISNSKRVKYILEIFLVLLLLVTFCFCFSFMVSFEISERYLFCTRVVLMVIFLLLLARIWSLKYFEYEHSGEVITIRSYHPVRKSMMVAPSLEVPKDQVLTFGIVKSKLHTYLVLTINGRRDKQLTFNYNLYGMSRYQVRNIEKTLQNS